MKKITKEQGAVIFWSIALLFLSGTIVYLNLTKLPYNIDTDFIAEIDYSRAVWEYGNLFPKQWTCANELMFFRPTVLAALLYGMTGKYIFSYAAALCMMLVCILACAWYLLGSFPAKASHKCMALCLLLSFCGDGRSFIVLICLYYGYYGLYIAAMCLTIGALARIYAQRPVHRLLLVSLSIIAFLQGIVGVRMTAMLYVPIGLAAGWLYRIWKKENKPANQRFLSVCTGLLVINVGGLLAGKLLIPHEMIHADLMRIHISNFNSVLEIFWKNLVGVLHLLLGTAGGMEIVSIETFDIAVKALLLGTVFLMLKKQGFHFKTDFIVSYSLLYMILILMLTTFTDMGNGYYTYYFFLPVAVIYLMLHCMAHTRVNVCLPLLAFLMLATNFMVHYEPDFSSKADESTAKLVQWLTDNGIDQCTAYFWTAGPIEALSDGQIRTAYLKEGSKTDMRPEQYLADDSRFDPAFTDCHVILTDEQENNLLENSTSRLHTWKCEKIAEIDTYNIYKFAQNPAAAYVMPDVGETVVHLPREHFFTNNSVVLEDGTVSSKGEEEFVLYGPYSDRVKNGVYTVEMDYELLSENGIGQEVGWIDISKDGGTSVAKTCIIPEQKSGTAAIEQIELKNANLVEIRMYAHAGYQIKLRNIKITRIK